MCRQTATIYCIIKMTMLILLYSSKNGIAFMSKARNNFIYPSHSCIQFVFYIFNSICFLYLIRKTDIHHFTGALYSHNKFRRWMNMWNACVHVLSYKEETRERSQERKCIAPGHNLLIFKFSNIAGEPPRLDYNVLGTVRLIFWYRCHFFSARQILTE